MPVANSNRVLWLMKGIKDLGFLHFQMGVPPSFEGKKARVRARHKAINRRLSQNWRHPKWSHHITIGAGPNMIELTVMQKGSTHLVIHDDWNHPNHQTPKVNIQTLFYLH